MRNNLKPKECAKLMGVSEQYVRMGIRTGKLPFGTAVKLSSKYTYYISPAKFTEFTGISICAEDENENI